MPVYNGGAYLVESIASVLTQTYQDFCLIVSDDCSYDNTEDIAHSFCDPRLCVVRNPQNLGLVGNFNQCLTLAKSEYIYLWHQDDVMMPENLQRKVDVLDNLSKVGFVHSNSHLIDGEGNTLQEFWSEESKYDYVLPGLEFFHSLISGSCTVCCPSVLARTECYKRLGGFHSELPLACDYEMWMRISLYYDVACLGTPLIKYRWHTASEGQRFYGTLRELEQNLLAKMLVLKGHAQRVPSVKKMRRAARNAIAPMALSDATKAYYSRNFKTSWAYWRFAMKLQPKLISKPWAMGLLGRLILGPGGVSMCRWVKGRPLARTK